MAIPDVPGFSLGDVLAELSLEAPAPLTLSNAINTAVPSYFDSSYNTGTIDRLSNFRNYPVITPSIPTNLIATNIGANFFKLNWTGSAGATNYKIYKNDVEYTTTGNSTAYKTMAQLDRNASDTWKVRACNVNNSCSGLSIGLQVFQLRSAFQLTSTTGYSSSALACADQQGQFIYYHNGDTEYPLPGDEIFTTSLGVGVFNGGFLFWRDYGLFQNVSYEVNTAGVIISATNC
tara:strand:+ start:652 stop:1350 length:699 start_codon:yes stop_codon:yes gene_type:complete